MSRASDTFPRSIPDAENLLEHFNTLDSKPPPPEIEALKRAALVGDAIPPRCFAKRTSFRFLREEGKGLFLGCLARPSASRSRGVAGQLFMVGAHLAANRKRLLWIALVVFNPLPQN